jgi:hypothetical protein
MDTYGINVENQLRKRGRVLTGWWDNQPIHRAMTNEERATAMGLDPLTTEFAIALLGNRNYKPRV